MRLDLWNAEVNGNLQANGGEAKIKCLTLANNDVIVIEVTGKQPLALTWHPDSAVSTRQGLPKRIHAYPKQYLRKTGNIQVSIQDMPDDTLYMTQGRGAGQYATAWQAVKRGNTITYYISMGFSYPGTTAVSEAIARVKNGAKTDLTVLIKQHRNWWHQYYPRSFVSIPEHQMESFYWIQLYKMASASRRGGPILDLMGPWFMRTGWPAIWWNLNIQLTYWPFYMSNHLEEASPLAQTVWNDRLALAKNAAPFQNDSYAIGRATAPDGSCPVGSEVGNLPWVMHNLWMYYRSSMNDKYLKTQLFPLMKGSFNYLKHILVKQADGKYFMPQTASPEFTNAVDNSSYTLACLRWLSATIIKADQRLKSRDAIVFQCKDVLNNLVDYETDATGFMVGKGMPLNKSHRHWSHLFMIYPFHEYTFADTAQRPLIKRSLANWVSMPQAFAGYSWLGAASISSSCRNGDQALAFLHSFLGKSPNPNTLYREGSPVIETPLAYDRTLQELLMTSDGDAIQIFPGIPSTWKDVSFANLRAEGAFLVSAQLRGGVLQFIKITSLMGEPCSVATGMQGKIKVSGCPASAMQQLGQGMIKLRLKKGESALLYTGAAPIERISMVSQSVGSLSWGEINPAR
jgi:alpha-L-fucosidase 2